MHLKLLSYKVVIILIFWCITNGICIHYYAQKYIGNPISITIAYFLIFVFCLFFAQNIIREKFLSGLIWMIFLAFIIICIYFFQLFPKESNGNDKWSDIVAFWDKFLSGLNGWSARGHLGNRISSMPTNLILAFPFYYFNTIDYFSLFSFLVFWLYFYKNRLNPKIKFNLGLIILISPVVFLEITGRSNLLLNGTIFLFAVDYLFSILKNKSSYQVIIAAIFMGISMAYRLAFAPALIMICFYFFLSKKLTILQLLLYIFVIGLTLIFLFLPFIWNHFDDFMQNHPFIKQAKITKTQTFIIVLLALFFATKIRELSDLYFYTIILVFLSVLLGCYLYRTYTTLLYNAMIFPLIIKYLTINLSWSTLQISSSDK